MFVSRRAGFAALYCFAALMTIVSNASALCTEAGDPDDPGVVILRCAGVVIAAEATAVRSPVLAMSAHPHTIQLDAGAIAISSDASAPIFTALTPDAVLWAREAEWFVVADSGRTQAAVRRGTITARLRLDGSEKVLRADDAELGALEPKRTERLSQALQRSKNQP